MARHDRRGRSNKGPPFAQLYHWIRRTDAWRSLNPYARLLYIELRAKYDGTNNGAIPMAYREAQDLLGCSNKPMPGAFAELQDRGFIVAAQRGSFDWKAHVRGEGRATTWRLTELPQDYPQRELATLDFKGWKKTRHAQSVPDARPKRATKTDMARRQRTNGTPRAGHSGDVDPVDGTPRAGTSISTISVQVPADGEQPDAQPIQRASASGLPHDEPLQISQALMNTSLYRRAREHGR